VQLAVAYCGVCGTDMHIFHGTMDGRVPRPMTIGHEASGIVTAIGKGVSNVVVGDRVVVRPLHFGAPHPADKGHAHIGKNLKFIGIDSPGAFQNSWTVPAYTIHQLPKDLMLQHGAMIEPLAVACHDVKVGRVKAGEHCLVIGGGPIGTLIALVLRAKGAKVVVSEVNPKRLDMLKGLGLATIDAANEDLVAKVDAYTHGQMIDCAFEVSGAQAGVAAMTQVVCARGRIVMVAIHGGEPRTVDLFKFFWSEIEMLGARLYTSQDYEEAIGMALNGDIPFDALITQVDALENIQEVFQSIDQNPAGMKYLIDCQN